ncbi:MAG: Asp-tRNA(Asn)/Glu-tRNA(Gln) amidotransferase subunit GatC [Deltaproteobacteria bacterium]|nr:Asp-tRNA(Asn)/Glu-tRNA(Gln) amidotransferase subunit GatC [Deltaproteobacteria bacterium]
MKISPKEVEHLAVLARLELSPPALELYGGQMNDILGYVEKLAELETEGLEPTTHATGAANAFREDEVKPSLAKEEALQNAPASDGESIIVPRVI